MNYCTSIVWRTTHQNAHTHTLIEFRSLEGERFTTRNPNFEVSFETIGISSACDDWYEMVCKMR